MQWNVELPAGDGYAVVTTSGTFDVADHLRMIEDIVSRHGWRPGLDVLFDHRGLEFGEAGYLAMQQAGGNHVGNDARIGNGKAAVLMRTPGDFGRGRQFELMMEGRVSASLCIFLDEAEARGWLAGEAA